MPEVGQSACVCGKLNTIKEVECYISLKVKYVVTISSLQYGDMCVRRNKSDQNN